MEGREENEESPGEEEGGRGEGLQEVRAEVQEEEGKGVGAEGGEGGEGEEEVHHLDGFPLKVFEAQRRRSGGRWWDPT